MLTLQTKNGEKKYSDIYWLIPIIFLFVGFFVQLISLLFAKKQIAYIDFFQLILAPAVCISISSLLGFYHKKLYLILSLIYVWFISFGLYNIFIYFSSTDILSIKDLMYKNYKLFSIPLFLEIFLSSYVSYIVINNGFKNNEAVSVDIQKLMLENNEIKEKLLNLEKKQNNNKTNNLESEENKEELSTDKKEEVTILENNLQINVSDNNEEINFDFSDSEFNIKENITEVIIEEKIKQKIPDYIDEKNIPILKEVIYNKKNLFSITKLD